MPQLVPHRPLFFISASDYQVWHCLSRLWPYGVHRLVYAVRQLYEIARTPHVYPRRRGTLRDLSEGLARLTDRLRREIAYQDVRLQGMSS